MKRIFKFIKLLLVVKDLEIDHKQGLCNCNLSDGGYNLCLYEKYKNNAISLGDLVGEVS